MFKNHNIYIIGRILMKFYSQVELTMLTILHITIIIYISLSFTDIYLQNVKKKHTHKKLGNEVLCKCSKIRQQHG